MRQYLTVFREIHFILTRNDVLAALGRAATADDAQVGFFQGVVRRGLTGWFEVQAYGQGIISHNFSQHSINVPAVKIITILLSCYYERHFLPVNRDLGTSGILYTVGVFHTAIVL